MDSPALHCRVKSTVYTVSDKKTLPCYFCNNSVCNFYNQPNFIIFGHLILYEICNKIIYRYRVNVKKIHNYYTRVVKLCLLLHWWSEFVWAEGNRSGAIQKFTWAQRWAGVEKTGGAACRAGGGGVGMERWAEITEMGFNAERQNSNRVSAEKITTGVLYIRVFAQSAVRQYNNQTILADLLERYSVSVPPVSNNIYRSTFRLQNICRSGVPPRSGTTTAPVDRQRERADTTVSSAEVLFFHNLSNTSRAKLSFFCRQQTMTAWTLHKI